MSSDERSASLPNLKPAWLWIGFALAALAVPAFALAFEGRPMTAETIGDALARLNAFLNFSSFALLVTGIVMIKQRRVKVHRLCMKAAIWTSGVFLASYVTRWLLTGTHYFPNVGLVKTIYLVILLSHMTLAVVVLPMVLRAQFLADRGRLAEHKRIAKITYPIWLYVSVTGIVVYAMLYHLAPRLAASGAMR